MKAYAPVFLGLLLSLSLHGQGTTEFTVALNGAYQVPPNASAYTGSGSLSLQGGVLNYSIGIQAPFFFPTGASVHGPALPGQNAAPVFGLGPGTIFDPGPGTPGSLAYLGSQNLTQPQINDLLAGLWYVNLSSDAFPNGEIRGQITVVPEPSTLALVTLGGAALLLVRRRHCRRATKQASVLTIDTRSKCWFFIQEVRGICPTAQEELKHEFWCIICLAGFLPEMKPGTGALPTPHSQSVGHPPDRHGRLLPQTHSHQRNLKKVCIGY